MGEHQPPDPHPARRLSDVQQRHVPADPAAEADRAIPARGVGEQQVGARGPRGKGAELWGPGRHRCRGGDPVADGRPDRVLDRARLDGKVRASETGHARLEVPGTRQTSDVRAQLRLLIGHQPGVQDAVRLRAGPPSNATRSPAHSSRRAAGAKRGEFIAPMPSNRNRGRPAGGPVNPIARVVSAGAVGRRRRRGAPPPGSRRTPR